MYESVRRQVPELDPVYQQARERPRKAYSNEVFAYASVGIYERETETIKRVTDHINELEQELSKIAGSGDETAQRLSESIKRDRAFLENEKPTEGQHLRKDFINLARELINLMDRPIDDDLKSYVYSEVRYMFDSEEIRDQLKKYFGDDLKSFTPMGLFVKIVDGSIPNELLCAVAKRHIEHIHEQEKELEKIVTETKQEFKEAVKTAVAENRLPLSAAEALQRIDSVEVTLTDKMKSIRSSALGDSADSGEITVNNIQLRPQLIPRLKKTLFHEFLHELSGKSVTIMTKTEEFFYGPQKVHDVSHRKSGIALHKPNSSVARYTWLNEAITEWLAIKLSKYNGDSDKEGGYSGSFSYTEERRELDRLFASGLEEITAAEAYFENISSDHPQAERGKNFAKFIRRINEVEGKYGFAKLENKHTMNEVHNCLYGNYVFPAERVAEADIASLAPEAKVFRISIAVGIKEETVVRKKFVYIAKPITVADKTLTVEEQWKEISQTLGYLEMRYMPRLKYSVVEE